MKVHHVGLRVLSRSVITVDGWRAQRLAVTDLVVTV